MKPQVIGHRGASAAAPENTLPAFRLAFAQGADGIEIDVRWAAGGALAVHHDVNLSDGRAVAATVRGELPPSVPTLGEVLAAGPWFVNIEIKNDPAEPGRDLSGDSIDGLVDGVVGEVAAHDAGRRVLLSSFDWATVCRARTVAPDLAVAWLVWTGTPGDPAGWVARAAGAGMRALNPQDALVDAGLIAAAHRAGLAVNVWTVDDPDRIRALARLGVDAVITNDPAGALAALASFRQP